MGQPSHVKAVVEEQIEEMRKTNGAGEGRESQRWTVSDTCSREKEQQIRNGNYFFSVDQIVTYTVLDQCFKL